MNFRQYDAGLGRFYGLDLLAEATPWATPNHFALNNPVMASDPTGLLATWAELVQAMNDFATSGGGGGGGGNASWSFTSNMNSNGSNSWGFDMQYSNGTGTTFNEGSISGVGFSINSYNQGNGCSWQTTTTLTASTINDGQWVGGNSNQNRLDTVVLSGKKTKQRIEDTPFFKGWNNVNNLNDQLISPVTGVFEAGAIVAGASITTASSFNKVALAETISNAKVIKVAGNISRVATGLGIGYAAAVALSNPTKSNIARLAAQGAILGLEVGANALVPGLGFLVGFDLSALENSDYVQGLYKRLD